MGVVGRGDGEEGGEMVGDGLEEGEEGVDVDGGRCCWLLGG